MLEPHPLDSGHELLDGLALQDAKKQYLLAWSMMVSTACLPVNLASGVPRAAVERLTPTLDPIAVHMDAFKGERAREKEFPISNWCKKLKCLSAYLLKGRISEDTLLDSFAVRFAGFAVLHCHAVSGWRVQCFGSLEDVS